MTVRREAIVEERLRTTIANHPGGVALAPGDEPISGASPLTRREAVLVFESMLQSRLQDLEARRLKDKGLGFYTIGSSGHETNAVFGHLLRSDDPACLHYRSAALVAARARKVGGETPLFDAMLSFVASSEDPISGGRHKVLGSSTLWIPPQTSTIASHLPKAAGMAFAIDRLAALGLPLETAPDAVVYCSFGDASANHATAQAGFNLAAACALAGEACPVIFACEDNGIGISVETPDGYIAQQYAGRAGLRYFAADGRDLAQSFAVAKEAIEFCRTTRLPVFFHLRTVRLLGHAGTDVETTYWTEERIDANEERDPMLLHAQLLLDSGAITKEGLLALYADLEERVRRAGEEAVRRPKLTSATDVIAPLRVPKQAELTIRVGEAKAREAAFEGELPERDARPRHFAFRVPQALKDLMVAYPNLLVFGEDVARKGGVYHATDGLFGTFGVGRVFNTILDETSILGIAQGAAQVGALPFPEIQYLAYVHNAIDQIRGEAASLKFFSRGQYVNGMVVRIAGYGYQKGFGGHFHNDNSIGALLEIPGLVIASPSRADDAVTMLRTLAAAAWQHGTVGLFLEPIALYMTKDVHEKGDGLWLFPYPQPGEACPIGEPRIYAGSGKESLLIVSWANGLLMSLQAQRTLAKEGIHARVLDLRWLAPLPHEAIREHAAQCGRVLVVDECRKTHAGPSAAILAELAQAKETAGLPMRRITGEDTYIPLGPAANLVMVQTDDIVRAARELAGRATK